MIQNSTAHFSTFSTKPISNITPVKGSTDISKNIPDINEIIHEFSVCLNKLNDSISQEKEHKGKFLNNIPLANAFRNLEGSLSKIECSFKRTPLEDTFDDCLAEVQTMRIRLDERLMELNISNPEILAFMFLIILRIDQLSEAISTKSVDFKPNSTATNELSNSLSRFSKITINYLNIVKSNSTVGSFVNIQNIA